MFGVHHNHENRITNLHLILKLFLETIHLSKMFTGRIYCSGLLMLFLCFTVVTCACPDNCICSHNQNSRPTASCRLEKDLDYDLLMGLHENTMELECTVKGSFIENLFQVQHLVNLQRLVFWPEELSRFNSYSSNQGTFGFNKPEIFHSLRELRHLGVHISLSNFNGRILQSLEHLQVLDLSHAEGLSTYGITSLLRRINEIRSPLFLLNLTRVHVTGALGGMSFEPLNARTHIYQHIKNLSTLQILDIRDNGILELQGGLSEFLPTLKELYLGENVYSYFAHGIRSTLCSLLDITLHPALRKLYYSFIPGAKYRIRKSIKLPTELIDTFHYWAKWCMLRSHYYRYCEVLNCMCNDEMVFPCSMVDDERIKNMMSPNHQAISLFHSL